MRWFLTTWCLLITACNGARTPPPFVPLDTADAAEDETADDGPEDPDEGEEIDEPEDAEVTDGEEVTDASDADEPERPAPCKPGADCDDNDACTVADSCDDDGICQGIPMVCDDGDPCTDDECVPVLGLCDHTPATGTPCDDGDPCTFPDLCDFGTCKPTGGECPPCGSDDDCADLDDDDLCNGTLRCVDTKCVIDPDSVVTCDDLPVTPCEQAVCVGSLGICAVEAKPPGSACEASSPCEEGGACLDGTCEGTPVTCDDDNPCTANECEPAAGGCTFPPISDGVLCNDGDPCTLSDECIGGQCIGDQDPECGQ